MKKTLFAENAFGQVYVWGYKGNYTFQLVKTSDRNLVSDADYRSAAKRFFSVQKFHSQDVFKSELEKFMGLGVYGMFNMVKNTDNTFSLKSRRYIPDEVREKYRREHQADNQAGRLNEGISSVFA